MQFKIYDVLASLIPGTLVLGIILITVLTTCDSRDALINHMASVKDFSAIITSMFLVVSYIIGYIVHALGSWFEPFLWFTWKGRPSELLLKNKTKRLGVVGAEAILKHLVDYCSSKNIVINNIDELTRNDYRILFQVAKTIAYSKTDGSIKERMTEFSNSYIFSRNILISIFVVFISSIVWVISGYIAWWVILVLFVIQLLLWFRCRDKAIYYSREILTAAYYLNDK
ncbi:MAG TPA: hypothetical protein ENJ95_01665 [Bacteroidetes bacterium]|nr:hypothetical protein [Bacteroidota bacterium]